MRSQSRKSYPYALTENGKPYLKKDNSCGYYEQVQMQMGLPGISMVHFVLCTDVDVVYFPIEFDEALFSDLKLKLQQWHETCIMPMLTSGKCFKFIYLVLTVKFD